MLFHIVAILQFFSLLRGSAFAEPEDENVPGNMEAPDARAALAEHTRIEHRVLSPGVVLYDSRATFDAATSQATLICENFSDSPASQRGGAICSVTEISSTTTPNTCVNSVKEGFSIASAFPGNSLSIFGRGFSFGGDMVASNAIGPRSAADNTDITFTTPLPTNVVSLDLFVPFSGNFVLGIFDIDGNGILAQSQTLSRGFVGIHSTTPIGRIRIVSLDGAPEAIENLCFGGYDTTCGSSILFPQESCNTRLKCCDPTIGLVGPDCCESTPFNPALSSCCDDGTIVAGSDVNCVPSGAPTSSPSNQPSGVPSSSPSNLPSSIPSGSPSSQPSVVPSSTPSGKPSSTPSSSPSNQPSSLPSVSPSSQPSSIPSISPSSQPSAIPSSSPIDRLPSISCGLNFLPPQESCGGLPFKCCDQILGLLGPDCCGSLPFDPVESSCCGDGTIVAGSNINCAPSGAPSATPSNQPSASSQPSGVPSSLPSTQPSSIPSSPPSSQPSDFPHSEPSGRSTCDHGPVCDYDFKSDESGGIEVKETYFAVCEWHDDHYHQSCYPESLVKEVGSGQMIPGTDDHEIVTCGCCPPEDGTTSKVKGSTPVCNGALDCFAADAVFTARSKKSSKKAKKVKFETCIDDKVFMEENFYAPAEGEIVSCGGCTSDLVI